MTRVIIVDGYNVIRSTPPYADLAEEDFDAARTALVSDVAAFAHGEYRAVVVFDGAGNPHSDGVPHEVAGVTVVFSPHGVEADTIVERYARRAREAGDQVEVVTSDAQTQWAVLGFGVARRSSAEFSGDLRLDRERWAESNPTGSASCRIEERIDPDVRARLERWARGDS